MKSTQYYDQPLYGIFLRENGVLMGYVEDSFSMSFNKEYVRLWPKADIEFWNKRICRDKRDLFIVRVRSKKCPVDVTLNPITKDMGKYQIRNKRFTVK